MKRSAQTAGMANITTKSTCRCRGIIAEDNRTERGSVARKIFSIGGTFASLSFEAESVAKVAAARKLAGSTGCCAAKRRLRRSFAIGSSPRLPWSEKLVLRRATLLSAQGYLHSKELESVMPRVNRQVIPAMASIVTLLSASLLSAQDGSSAPAAPVPAQIANAKKAFISNAGEQRDLEGDLRFTGGPDRAYNQFYAAIRDWGNYALVATPADADLVLQVHLADLTGSYDELRLTLLDPKSHVTLWTFSEHAATARSQKARDASFDRARSLISMT